MLTFLSVPLYHSYCFIFVILSIMDGRLMLAFLFPFNNNGYFLSFAIDD